MYSVEVRYKEEEGRAPATRDLLNCIVEHRMAAGSLPPSERDAVSFFAEVTAMGNFLKGKEKIDSHRLLCNLEASSFADHQ